MKLWRINYGFIFIFAFLSFSPFSSKFTISGFQVIRFNFSDLLRFQAFAFEFFGSPFHIFFRLRLLALSDSDLKRNSPFVIVWMSFKFQSILLLRRPWMLVWVSPKGWHRKQFSCDKFSRFDVCCSFLKDFQIERVEQRMSWTGLGLPNFAQKMTWR